VPSVGEWNQLLIAWKNEYPEVTLGTNNGYATLPSAAVSQFREDLLLPMVGYRPYGASSLGGTGTMTYFWSSSPNVDGASEVYTYANSLTVNYK
jgi:hypothetical protein